MVLWLLKKAIPPGKAILNKVLVDLVSALFMALLATLAKSIFKTNLKVPYFIINFILNTYP